MYVESFCLMYRKSEDNSGSGPESYSTYELHVSNTMHVCITRKVMQANLLKSTVLTLSLPTSYSGH